MAGTVSVQPFATVLAATMASSAADSAHSGHAGVGTVGSMMGDAIGSAIKDKGGNLDGSRAPQSRHLPIGRHTASGGHDLQERALALRAYRQQLLASNIANADTPGYQAVDIDINEAMRLAGTPPLALTTSSTWHLAASIAPQFPLAYRWPLQPSADGNTVDMDGERARFAENALMYQFSLDRVSGHYKHLMEMLQSLKD